MAPSHAIFKLILNFTSEFSLGANWEQAVEKQLRFSPPKVSIVREWERSEVLLAVIGRNVEDSEVIRCCDNGRRCATLHDARSSCPTLDLLASRRSIEVISGQRR